MLCKCHVQTHERSWMQTKIVLSSFILFLPSLTVGIFNAISASTGRFQPLLTRFNAQLTLFVAEDVSKRLQVFLWGG